MSDDPTETNYVFTVALIVYSALHQSSTGKEHCQETGQVHENEGATFSAQQGQLH